MGRTKTKYARASRLKVEPSTSVVGKSAPSTAALFEKAQVLVSQFNFDLAHKFLVRILEREPSHLEAREWLGEVQLEMGELDAAKQTFESLLPPSPYAPKLPSSAAHLNLAQLSDDPREAICHYQAATDILLAQLKGKERAMSDEGASTEEDIKSKIVSGLVAMVEIWMTDLCMEDEAESTCESLATLALQTDPTSGEALQMLASVRMSQKRPQEAQECAERAWERWKDLDPDSPIMPPLPVRLSLTRLFLELSLFAHALATLEGVLAIDDQEVEAWYLRGWCFFLMTEKAHESNTNVEELSWEELARDARDSLERCQILHTTQGHPDEQIVEHTREIIAELAAAGVELSPEEEVVEEGAEDDDAWEDEDGDIEME